VPVFLGAGDDAAALFATGVVVEPCVNLPPAVLCATLIVDPTVKVDGGAVPVACLIADCAAPKAAVEVGVTVYLDAGDVVPVDNGGDLGVVAILYSYPYSIFSQTKYTIFYLFYIKYVAFPQPLCYNHSSITINQGDPCHYYLHQENPSIILITKIS
jgi:hypothetical protein